MSNLYSQAEELARLAFVRIGLLEDLAREEPTRAPSLAPLLAGVRMDVQVDLAEASVLQDRLKTTPPCEAPEARWHLQRVLNRLARTTDMLDGLLCALTPGRAAEGPALVERFPAPDDGALFRHLRHGPAPRLQVLARRSEGRAL